jgi:pyridoxamine 5'-phosphate oxidase
VVVCFAWLRFDGDKSPLGLAAAGGTMKMVGSIDATCLALRGETMDFQSLRKEYEEAGLHVEGMNLDPLEEFKTWFQAAVANQPGPWLEPNAMTLATADRRGRVTARTVLLKGFSDRRFVFFTNYESEKARQLADNPQACLLFHWHYLGRQVRIDGRVERTSSEESLTYFQMRPRGAQLGAHASQQSQPIEHRADLEARFEQVAAKFGDGPIPLPESWGGYCLTPQRIEFWQGRISRLHDRIVYELADGHWKKYRICP